jgi:hypothetical protein
LHSVETKSFGLHAPENIAATDYYRQLRTRSGHCLYFFGILHQSSSVDTVLLLAH